MGEKWWGWTFFGNQEMSQSHCVGTFGFPVGIKKHVRVQNAIRRLCAVTAGVTAIFLSSIHIHRQMKRGCSKFLSSLPKRACDLDRFILCELLSLERGKERG